MSRPRKPSRASRGRARSHSRGERPPAVPLCKNQPRCAQTAMYLFQRRKLSLLETYGKGDPLRWPAWPVKRLKKSEGVVLAMAAKLSRRCGITPYTTIVLQHYLYIYIYIYIYMYIYIYIHIYIHTSLV